MTAREALADALSTELDLDITPEFMQAVDKVLIRLYLHGYIVTEAPEETEDAAAEA